MWRMPASTNASYVGRFAPPGSPNATSTPSAFKHAIKASTARIAPRSFPKAWGKSQCTSGFSADSGRADRDADAEGDGAPHGHHQQRASHRHVEEAVPDPGDREQLERDDDAGDDERAVDVGDDERKRVEDAPERRHPPCYRPAHDRAAAPCYLSRVRQRLRPAHAD